MKKNKVNAVVKYFYPVAAGIETNMLETYGMLAKSGRRACVYTSDFDYTTGAMLKVHEMVNGIDVQRSKLTKLGFFPALSFTKADVVALHNFDVMPHFWIMFYSLIRKILGVKNYVLVLTPHGGFNPEWSIFSRWQAAVKAFYHYTVGVALINSTVDGVRAVSEWEKDEMIRKGIKREKIRVISNGIEDDAFSDVDKLASEDTKKRVKGLGEYIIQVGRIYPIKNYETVIRALPSIRKEVKYVIVGPIADKKYLEGLKKLARSLGVEKRVIFWGVIRGIDKFYLMKHARLMVHMALWESFCNVVHEGMSQGLPVIVANNTALPYLVKEGVNGYLVGTKDYKKVGEKINYVLDNADSEEVRRIIEVNSSFGLEHAWKRVAEKMDVYYRELMEK